jgi:Pyruvate/2-oxoacid:ferredoxin oxidoreductase delta subunit
MGAPAPRPVTVVQRRLKDYPGVSEHHLAMVGHLSSPLLFGPPICDELVAFVQHVFTEEEASLARHLNGFVGRSAADVARAAHLRVEDVAPILHRLAFEKFVIYAVGTAADRKYRLMAVMFGIFELSLMPQDLETMSPWHRRLAELFEALFDTGYAYGEGKVPFPSVRFLPLKAAIEGHPAALPSDKMEVVIDRFSSFAVTNCQCRMARRVVDKGCDKPLRNCLSMGTTAEAWIRTGQQKRITKKDALEIKAEAEANGLVSWIMNVESNESQGSCSCCGCCCASMRTVNEFSAPAMAAPPHFMPRFDRSRCTYCGKCARACPMGSLVVDTKQKTAWQLVERCIGCGLCTLSCDTQKAATMEPVPDYRLPPSSWYALIAGAAPSLVYKLARTYALRSPIATWWKG